MAGREISSTSIDAKQHGTDHDPRTRRAIEEEMDVLFVGIGAYVVHSASGNQYEVDVFEASCTCPDWENPASPAECKHLRRVDLEIDAGTVPRPDGRIGQTSDPNPRPRAPEPIGGTIDSESEHRITGPIPEFDQYGRSTGTTYWRCESCGREALRRRDLETGGCERSVVNNSPQSEV